MDLPFILQPDSVRRILLMKNNVPRSSGFFKKKSCLKIFSSTKCQVPEVGPSQSFVIVTNHLD